MRAWLPSCGLDLHAIQSSRTPKMVYSTDAAWCVALREIRLGSTYPSAVEIICRARRVFSQQPLLQNSRYSSLRSVFEQHFLEGRPVWAASKYGEVQKGFS